MMAVLQAGDANQDLYVDQADLIQAFKSGKYLTDQSATWSDGDWNGGPGGAVGQPPAGNGRFDQNDITTVNLNLYRKGPYDVGAGDAVDDLDPLIRGNVGELTLQYNRLQKSITLETRGKVMTTLHFHSSRGIFAGHDPLPTDELRTRFSVNTANDIFAINATNGIKDAKIRLNDRYSLDEILADLQIDGSWKSTRDTRVEYDPATGSVTVSNSSTTLTALEIASRSSQLRPENVDAQLFPGLFDLRTTSKLFKLLPDGFASADAPLVLQGALPTGLTRTQLQSDLRISGAERPDGSITYELVVKGEPHDSLPLALDSAGVYCACEDGSGTIGGRVFRDANQNGLYDANEQAFTGWSVQLVATRDGAIVESAFSSMDVNQNGTVEPSEQGVFLFDDLPPGEYDVTVTPIGGYEFVSLPGNKRRVNLQANQQANENWFPATQIPIPLKVGDANQDFYVDEADLIQAFKSGKYRTDQAASWSEGDWNGGPGGQVGQPPVGNGRFDQNDIANMDLELYRKGPYATGVGNAVDDLGPLLLGDVGELTLQYFRLEKYLIVDTHGKSLSTLHLHSPKGIFASYDPLATDELSTRFSVSSSNDIFVINGTDGIKEMKVRLNDRYSLNEILADLQIDGSWKSVRDTRVEYDPATGSLTVSNPNTTLTALELISSSSQFRPENVDPQLFPGLFDVHTAKKLFKLQPTGFASADAPLVFNGALPPGLTRAQLQSDLRIAGAQRPAGSISYELVVKGEQHDDLPRALESAGIYCKCEEGSGTIGGRVFNDANRNGLFDAGEQAFTGWTVQLVAPQSATVIETVLSSMDLNQDGTSDPSEQGAFIFRDLPRGEYDVLVTPGRGYEFLGITDNLIHVNLQVDQRANENWFAATPIPGPLRPGDANQDLYIDEADLIQVFKAGKYRIDVAATWEEGDWNGGVGGRVGQPRPGNGRFDERDYGLFSRNLYRSGKYNDAAQEPKSDLHPLVTNAAADLTLDYDRLLKKLTVKPANLSSFQLTSDRSMFAGLRGVRADEWGSSFNVDTSTNVFAIASGGVGSFTIDLKDRYSVPELLSSLRVDGSWFRENSKALGAVNIACNCGDGDGSILGQVFQDTNRNGQRDAGEIALNGWNVELRSVDRGIVIDSLVSGRDVNSNGVIDASEEGLYDFTRLPSGRYSVSITPQRGYDVVGSRTLEINVGVDQQVTQQNFAIWRIPPAFVRGQIFQDLNSNQVRDPGEQGLNGVAVTADDKSVLSSNRDLNQDGVIDPETEQGLYDLEVVPDSYIVRAALPVGWNATTPTQVSTTLVSEQSQVIHFGMRGIPLGDLNRDFVVNAADIDVLFRSLREPTFRKRAHDLNGDQRINQTDVDVLVNDYLGTSLGDANLDRRFDSRDLVLVLQVGEYEDRIENNSTWAEGDWNGDGDFDAFDLVTALQTGRYSTAPPAAARANDQVPFDWSRLAVAAAPGTLDERWDTTDADESETVGPMLNEPSMGASPLQVLAIDQAIALGALEDGPRVRHGGLAEDGEDDEGGWEDNDRATI